MITPRHIVFCLLGFTALGVGYLGWVLIAGPHVDARPPAEELFSVPDYRQQPVALESYDFVMRPPFMPGRRPIETPVFTEQSPVGAAESGPDKRVLEGLSMMGVFSSGQTQGVILSSDDDTRMRLPVGGEYDGWELVEVRPRSAVFSVGDGPNADRVELSLVVVFPEPSEVARARPVAQPKIAAAVDASPGSETKQSGAAEATTPVDSAKAAPKAMSFGALDSRKKAARAAIEAENKAAEDSTE